MKTLSSREMSKALARRKITLTPAAVRYRFAKGYPRTVAGFLRCHRKALTPRAWHPTPEDVAFAAMIEAGD